MSKNEESFPTVIGRVRYTMPCPTLAFPGGEVTPRKPTAAELVLSAKQWTTRAHEELHEFASHRDFQAVCAASKALVRLASVLDELAACLK